MIEDWVNELCETLGVPADTVDVPALLDLARDAAHHVERPAAPITTYIVGLAAGQAGADPATVADLTERATQLARGWGISAPDRQ